MSLERRSTSHGSGTEMDDSTTDDVLLLPTGYFSIVPDEILTIIMQMAVPLSECPAAPSSLYWGNCGFSSGGRMGTTRCLGAYTLVNKRWHSLMEDWTSKTRPFKQLKALYEFPQTFYIVFFKFETGELVLHPNFVNLFPSETEENKPLTPEEFTGWATDFVKVMTMPTDLSFTKITVCCSGFEAWVQEVIRLLREKSNGAATGSLGGGGASEEKGTEAGEDDTILSVTCTELQIGDCGSDHEWEKPGRPNAKEKLLLRALRDIIAPCVLTLPLLCKMCDKFDFEDVYRDRVCEVCSDIVSVPDGCGSCSTAVGCSCGCHNWAWACAACANANLCGGCGKWWAKINDKWQHKSHRCHLEE